ncbi:translocation and assembly module lipoprotein TamL [Dysgonomonas macrotermitis]|uniref:Outer membrane protein assembly factor BamA n=1 Tax=Dysgonomonas macrotermitis TaxID=1346286 RepID=A0A1M5I2G2_9BACT|nr:BamA/TamA family outer membrane protein [Dysgonomonas macrotermitis]SHG22431.1 Outer membrane protein assembly factor BamA [Dysgonomonas macrotermitis]
MKKIGIGIALSISLWSCNSTKHVPDGQYMMNGYEINADTKKIDVTYLEDFVRQQPASSIRLGIYNLAGQDTSKWLNRTIQKMGQAPVIYSPQQTQLSARQIAQQLSNEGYLRVEVDTILKPKGKKMNITYDIQNNGIYTIRNYEYDIHNKTIARSLAPAKKYTSIQPGTVYNQDNIEASREHLTSYLRNIGYYQFSKEYLYFKVDSTLNSHQVDMYLNLNPSKDSTAFKRFKIRNVTVLSGFDPSIRGNKRIFQDPDTTYYKGMTFVHGSNNFLRNSTLYRNNFIRSDRYYSDMAYTRTTGALNGIGVVKKTDITYTPVSNPNDSVQLLDALVTVVPGNTHFFQTEIQGTNSAGDLGIAPSITYQHQNLFNGAEILKIKLRGAYEFISNSNKSSVSNQNYYEYGIDASLSFPMFLFPWLKRSWREAPSASTQISVGVNNQHRKEYTRQFFNTALTYRWASNKNRFNHSFSLWDVNYVRMPSVTDEFRENYLENKNNPILAESYKDQLISSLKYGITFTNLNTGFSRKVPKNKVTVRANIDLSGLLPRLVTSFYDAQKDSTGQKKIMGIAYAEYIKGDVSYSQTHTLDRNSSFAFRIGLGVAKPFGNSTILPFEVRYFSGGANSVRGWSTRDLGPGSYVPNDTTANDFANQVGDIKLDLGIEYRRKVSDYIELAGFVDAGNVWTINNYEGQPGGQFKFSEFYKEIALSYGAGLRFDLGFLLLRLDLGVRAYDPEEQKDSKWVIAKPRFNRMAWHFGIGYPF